MTKVEKKLLEEHTKAMRELAAAMDRIPRYLYPSPAPVPYYPLPYIPYHLPSPWWVTQPQYIVTGGTGTQATSGYAVVDNQMVSYTAPQ